MRKLAAIAFAGLIFAACGSPEQVGSESAALCNGVQLMVNPASPQSVGTSIQLSGNATCSAGTPEFRFWYQLQGTGWVLLQDWSATATATWNTTGLAGGTYTVEVDSRTLGSLPYEDFTQQTFVLNGPGPCSSVMLTAPATATAGTLVALSGAATCGGGATPEYRFWAQVPNGGAFTLLQDWSTTASTNWDTTGYPAGNFLVEVDARRQGAQGYDSYQQATVMISAGATCTAVGLSENPSSPQSPGVTVVLTATPTCGNGAIPEYRFWLQAPGFGYSLLQDWSTSATVNWDTTGATAGTYGLEADIRHQGSASYEAFTNQTYLLNAGASCGSVMLSTNPASPQTAGTAVTLTGAAMCTGGGTPEYRFWVQAPGAGFGLLQDWSASSTANWDTTGDRGTYNLEVDARHAGGVGYESTTTQQYQINKTLKAVTFGTPAFYATGNAPRSLTVADFSGDGIPDVATANFLDAAVGVLTGDGTGVFTAGATTYPVGNNPFSVTTADFNNDGKPDVATANSGSASVSVLINNGAGFAAQASFAVGNQPFGVRAGLINNDGNPDIVAANFMDNTVTLLIGDGAGGFGGGTTFAVGAGSSMPGIGDFNNDGHNDVVVACYTANAVTLLLNNGAGSLGAASSWPAGTGPYTGIAIGDFNNDSRLDLAVADDAAGANSSAVLLGNGNGTFTPPTINAAGTSPIDAEAADLNSDGVMDYAVANLNSNDVTVYLSYGDGGFTSQSIAVGGHPMGGLPRSLALADVNGDSKPDILVSNFNSNFVTVVLNTTP